MSMATVEDALKELEQYSDVVPAWVIETLNAAYATKAEDTNAR